MSDLNENQSGVFGGVQFNGDNNGVENTSYFDGSVQKENATNIFGNFETSNVGAMDNATNFQPIGREKAITKNGLWSKIKAFLFQEIDLNAPIKVELTPYQQKVEDEINEFLHQEVTFKGIANLFKGKK
jgi:hypothetical protein